MLFALSSEHSVKQGIALSIRLLLQLGYDLSLSRNSSKALVLVAALCMNLFFIYFSADLTATMTSQEGVNFKIVGRSESDTIRGERNFEINLHKGLTPVCLTI